MSVSTFKLYKKLSNELRFKYSELDYVDQACVECNMEFEKHYREFCAKHNISISDLEAEHPEKVKQFSNKPTVTEEQKKILFNEGTERPFTSILLYEKREGFYHCANCGAKLFNSKSKYESGTGWPSFTESLPGAFKTKVDYSFGMKRTEYHCAKCGAHLGHVFDDGPGENGKRFCNNGLCLIFKPKI